MAVDFDITDGINHKFSVGKNVHSWISDPRNKTPVPYVDIAERDADPNTNEPENIGKAVQVGTLGSAQVFTLLGVNPRFWSPDIFGSGTDEFIELTDTPSSYSGASLQGVRVNAGETALEFHDLVDSFLELTDTPSSYSGQALKVVSVNAGETGLEFTVNAAGDVFGPASATDNALARFDLATGKLIQNSVGILSDAGILSGLTQITALKGSFGSSAPSTPQGQVNIVRAASGATVNALCQELVLEHPFDAGLSILTGNTGRGRICFGDVANNAAGLIFYDHNSDVMMIAALGNILLNPASAIIDASTSRIIDVVDPVDPQDAATRQFVFDNAGSGDVVGPGSAVDKSMPGFSGTTGKLIFDPDVAKIDTPGISLNPDKSLFQEVYPNTDKQVLALSLQDQLDRSSFGNDLLLEGSAAIVEGAGRIGKGLRLDSSPLTTGRVKTNSSLTFTDKLSVMFFVFPNGTSFGPVVAKIDSSIGLGWGINTDNNSIRILLRDNPTVTDITLASGLVPLSTWTHVGVTIDVPTLTLKVYINGVLTDTQVVSQGWTDSGRDLMIGSRLQGNIVGENLDGDISNVFVYNRVLEQKEIRTHYLKASQFLNQSSLIADRFKIDDTTPFATASNGTFTLTALPANGDTVTIGTKTYTWATAINNGIDGEVLIDATPFLAISNMIAAIVLGAGAGTFYSTATTLHPDAKAVLGTGDSMDVTARRPGADGNLILLETVANGSWNQATLTGGAGPVNWLLFDQQDNDPNEGANGEVIVKKLSDFPAPVAGVITLVDKTRYTIKGAINLGTNRFEFGGNGSVVFVGVNNEVNTITYEGTGTLFSNPTPIEGLVNIQMTYISTGAGATVFDLTSAPGGGLFSSLTNFTGFDNLGTVRGFNTHQIIQSIATGIVTGLNCIDCFINQIDVVLFQGTFAGTSAHIRFLGSGTSVIIAVVNVLIPLGAESSFFISPTISPNASVTIQNSITLGNGAFFESGDTGVITNIADNSIALTAVDSVTDNAGEAEFQISGTIPEVGQRVILQNFTTETSYNQTILVTAQGASFFRGKIESSGVIVPFVQNDTTGDYQSNSATVTSTAHGQSNDTPLLVTDTINFNAGYDIFFVQTNTFNINLSAAFPGVETTGNWDVGSLTEEDKRMSLQQNGDQKDSMIAGGWALSGNVSATTVASGVFNDIDFTGGSSLTYNERLVLVNPVNGAVRYDGLSPSTESIPLEFYIIPNNNSDREYDFKLLIDSGSGFVDLPDLIVTRVNVKGTNTLFSTRRTVLLAPGDIYKWVQAGVGTTNGFTAERGCSTI